MPRRSKWKSQAQKSFKDMKWGKVSMGGREEEGGQESSSS